ncbi:MAG: hypothetical protein HYU02_04085 [Thaumarchaeota archaeon]|nr:hypothetical protein [Nitrososphaerota archaeon]
MAATPPRRVETKAQPPRTKEGGASKPIAAEAAPERARKSTTRKPGQGETYWEKMDALFYRTMEIAELSYRTNRMINLIIVAIGVILVANSIAYTWYKQTADSWSLFSGGLGIVSFMSLFFTKPQTSINRALGNLTQLQMIYKAHARIFETISDYDYEKYEESGARDLSEIIQMDKELERATEAYVKLVEDYTEKDSTSEENESAKGNNKPLVTDKPKNKTTQ